MMSEMVLTQVYLEREQKTALTHHAKQSGRSVSDLLRDAVDATVAGVSTDELRQLDLATQSAQKDIAEMVAQLAENTKNHKKFIREINALSRAER
jgi:hypothetical protein